MPQINSYSQNHTRKNRNNNSKSNDYNNEINNIIEKIEKLEKLSNMKPKEYADVNGYADVISKELSKDKKIKGKFRKKLNTNQLRKFFGAVRNIEKNKNWNEIEPELYLLKPKLAVSVGRELIPEDFYKIMKTTMSKIDVGTDEEKIENFDTFVKFLEAIVAYHKYYV